MSYNPIVPNDELDFLNTDEENVRTISSWIKNEIVQSLQTEVSGSINDLMNALADMYLYILEQTDSEPNPNFANVYFEGQYIYDDDDNESQKGNLFVRDKMVFIYISESDGTNVKIEKWHDEGLYLATNEFLRLIKSRKA